MRHLVRPLILLAVIALGAGFTLGLITGCSSSQPTPVTQPAAPATTPAATPVKPSAPGNLEAKASTDSVASGTGAPDVKPTVDEARIKALQDEAAKVKSDQAKSLDSASVAPVIVKPFDKSKPLKCSPGLKDRCVENGDGSISLSDKPPGK